MAIKLWTGNPPESCDICNRKIQRTFIDGKTTMGPWAVMCPACRNAYGPKTLGTGLGQKYEATNLDGKAVWAKTQG